MRVALDLEDVLVRNVQVFIEELNQFIEENHGGEEVFSAADIDSWKFRGIREDLAELRGWKENTVEKFMFGDGNGWKGFYPVTEEVWENEIERLSLRSKDMIEQVEKLKHTVKNSDGELFIVTARENVESSIEQKIGDLGIRELIDGIIIETEKDELDFDVYIDDYPKLHQNLEESIQIMITQPWNREQELEKPHRRVEKLSEAAEVIQNLGTKV